jgi:hypothetical protein
MNPRIDRQPRQPPGRWPYPGDSPLVRARKLVHSCRALLHSASPDLGRQFDEMAIGFGETWIVPRLIHHDDDDLLDPADAADYLCTSTANIRRLRLAGRLVGHRTDEGWRYRVGDLRGLQSTRPRGSVGQDGS